MTPKTAQAQDIIFDNLEGERGKDYEYWDALQTIIDAPDFEECDRDVKQLAFVAIEEGKLNSPVSGYKKVIAYCDYIAHLIHTYIKPHDAQGLLHSVGVPQFDLDQDGAFNGTKKTITAVDVNGRKYKITVEEL